MRAKALLDRTVSFSARRSKLVIGIATLLAVAGLVAALTLDSGRATSAAGDGGGDAAAATADLREKFGGDPIVVLVRGRLTGMLLTEDVARLLSLEGCISGNVPRGGKPAAPVCEELARRKPVQVVYGPGTFINEAANQVLDRINFDRAREATEADRAAREARRVARRRGLSRAQQEQFAQEARRLVIANYAQRALELAVRFGLSSVPALNNPEFVLQLVFEPSLGAEVPKPRFAYLFPHSDAAVIQARLRPDLSGDERRRAVAMVREAVGAKPFELKFGDYVVSGSPVVAEGVAAGLEDSAPALVAAGFLFVTVALVLAFGLRPVFAPLGIGAAAAAITLGGVTLVGGSFSAGVAAALPLLIALGAGWGVYVQRASATPALVFAALVCACAFAALLISPVAMAREFGATMAAGQLVSLALAVTVGAAVTGVRRVPRPLRGRGTRSTSSGRGRRRRVPGLRVPRRLRMSARRTAVAASRIASAAARLPRSAWRGAHARPGRVLRIGLAVGVLGWITATQIDVTSDQNRLLPPDRLEARDLASLERETGTPGDVNLIVRSDRLLDPGVVRWMSSYQQRVLRQHGFRAGRPCVEADLCPALSLTNLFGQGRQSARRIRAVVDALPRYFSQNVITADRRTANIAFRMGSMGPEERQRVVDDLRAELDPPAGVDAELAGPIVVAADGEDDLAASLWLVAALAVVLVAVIVGAAARSFEAGALAGIPLLLTTGWALLILFLLPVEVDFLTATLAAVVVAVWTGPAVVALRGYRESRAHGLGAQGAIDDLRARGTVDALRFGAVISMGFLALAVCDIPALRDLGAAGALAVPLCGLGLALAVPATLVWADRRGGLHVPRTRAEYVRAVRALGTGLRAATRAFVGGTRRAGAAVLRGVPRAGRKMRALATRRSAS